MSAPEHRPRPPKELEKSVIEALIDAELFTTKYQVMTFAAAVGFAMDERKPLTKPGYGIRMDYFRTMEGDRAIDVIALAKSDDLRQIAADRQPARAKLFEEYAHAGLVELEKHCFGGTRTPREGLLHLVKRLLADKSSDDEYPWL